MTQIQSRVATLTALLLLSALFCVGLALWQRAFELRMARKPARPDTLEAR